jgi:hypothetical protein
MPIVGAAASQFKQVRWIGSGTSLATGSNYTLGVPTQAGDTIVFLYTNVGSPTLTSSTTGITWATNYKTSGGAAPQPVILLGYNANAGITSFNVSGTVAAGGGYCILLVSGLRSASNPVITTAQAFWASGGTGGTSGSMNLSGNSNVLLVSAASEFGTQSVASTTTSSGYAVNQRAINTVSRTIAALTSQAVTGAAAETVTFSFNAAQTGGLLVLALAHS